MHTNNEYNALSRRHNSYAEANSEMSKKVEELTNKLIFVTMERDRLSAQLDSEKENVQMLIMDNNTRYQSANKEVIRLRKLLKANNINPNPK